MTFGELWTLYLERHAKMNRSSWRNDADLHRLYLEGWRNRKISYITSEAIRELHQKIGTDNGMVTANHVHALIRLMFNKAIEWGWNKPNPAYAVIQVSLVRLKPHSPDYRWTKIIPAAFDPAATCPTFDQSLRYWFNEDQEMINFIAQLVGMGLTGDTSEQKLVKMLGNGKNGKSVLADMVAYLAGDYTTLYLLNILSPNLGRPNT